MFCPNCGAKTSTEQKFCRTCGLGLEKIALSLTEQLPTQPDENLMSQKERLERLGVAALSVFGAGLMGLILWAIVYKMMIVEGKFLTGLAFIGFMVMIGCGILSAILFAKAKEAEDAAGKRKIQNIEPTPTKELLTEGNFEPVPSVIDRTTDLLFAEKRETK
jgi:hypothetical protein